MSNRRVREARRWVSRVGLNGVDPETVGTELLRIESRDGKIEPAAVVEDARPKDSPLHPIFEWNNAKAGEQWRVHQARNLIRSVRLVEEDPETKAEAPVEVFIHVPETASDEDSGGYRSATSLVQTIDAYTAALSSLDQRVGAAVSAVEDLKRIAEKQPEMEAERLAKIGLAVQALRTADNVVKTLH